MSTRGAAAAAARRAIEQEQDRSDRARALAPTLRGSSSCAILTRYHGATNTRGARISATLAGAARRPRVYIGYPYELDELGRHTMAALALLDSMRREGDAYAPALIAAGGTAEGYAFIIETAPAY
jgi:hypothetical protein